MKLKIENIKLKQSLNEATFNDAFSKIEVGDVLIIKSGKTVYKVKVVNTFGSQVIFTYNNEIFIITPASFNGDTLETLRIIKSNDNSGKTVKGPTIKGVFNIIIQRDGETVAGVTPNVGRPDNQEKKIKQSKNQFQGRYEELFQDISNFTEGSTIEITTGKLVTSGSDKGSLAKNTITELKFYVKKTTDKMSFLKLFEVNGQDSAKYDELMKYLVVFSPSGLVLTNEGINLNLKYKDELGKINQFTINDIFGIDSGGEFDEMPNVDYEALMNSPRLKAIMYKNPSLLDKLLNRGPKGIIPLQNKLKSLGLYKPKKQNAKVQFKYEGEDIRPLYRFNFKDGTTYIGKFSKDNVIKRSSNNRYESMYLKLSDKVGDRKYKVEIFYDKIVDNKSEPIKVGEGFINIISTNY